MSRSASGAPGAGRSSCRRAEEHEAAAGSRPPEPGDAGPGDGSESARRRKRGRWIGLCGSFRSSSSWWALASLRPRWPAPARSRTRRRSPSTTRRPATPYPSQIVVSGEGKVGDVNVTLTAMSHTVPDDVDVLLVGPTGQSAIVMSDAGLLPQAVDLTFTFDDEAAGLLPETGELLSGTYRPSNWPRRRDCARSPRTARSTRFRPQHLPARTARRCPPSTAPTPTARGASTWSTTVARTSARSAAAGASRSRPTTGRRRRRRRHSGAEALGAERSRWKPRPRQGNGNGSHGQAADGAGGRDRRRRGGRLRLAAAFLNQVKAQTGKKLTPQQAAQLTDSANAIRTSLGC